MDHHVMFNSVDLDIPCPVKLLWKRSFQWSTGPSLTPECNRSDFSVNTLFDEMHKCWNVLLEVLWSLQHNDDDDEDNDDDDEDDDEDDVEYHGWSKHVGEWIGRVAEIAEHKEHDKDDKEMLLIVIMMMTIINYYDIDNMIWKVSTKLERTAKCASGIVKYWYRCWHWYGPVDIVNIFTQDLNRQLFSRGKRCLRYWVCNCRSNTSSWVRNHQPQPQNQHQHQHYYLVTRVLLFPCTVSHPCTDISQLQSKAF